MYIYGNGVLMYGPLGRTRDFALHGGSRPPPWGSPPPRGFLHGGLGPSKGSPEISGQATPRGGSKDLPTGPWKNKRHLCFVSRPKCLRSKWIQHAAQLHVQSVLFIVQNMLFFTPCGNFGRAGRRQKVFQTVVVTVLSPTLSFLLNHLLGCYFQSL